jgi:putative membrane protein
VPALVGLVLAIYAPFHVNEHWLPPELVGLFVLGALASAHTPLRRWLTSASRRNRQVAEAAAVAFLDEGVMLTEGRTGVLLYWSLLERRVQILADGGVHAAVPADEWNRLLFEAQASARNAHPVPLLLNTLTHGCHPLGALPASPSDRDELPNAPRVLA